MCRWFIEYPPRGHPQIARTSTYTQWWVYIELSYSTAAALLLFCVSARWATDMLMRRSSKWNWPLKSFRGPWWKIRENRNGTPRCTRCSLAAQTPVDPLCSRSAQLSKSVAVKGNSYANAQILAFGIMHSRPGGARTGDSPGAQVSEGK